MTFLETLLAQPLVEPLGWTLLHFLWQGAAVAILLTGVLGLLRHASANARYLAVCLALATMAACPAITFCRAIQLPPVYATIQQQNRIVTLSLPDPTRVVWEVAGDVARPDGEEERFARHVTAKTGSGELRLSQPTERRFFTLRQPILQAFVAVWLFGVAVLSVRLLGGWLWLQRMRRHDTRPASLAVQESIARLARRVAVTRPVRVLGSAWVQVPVVIGWLRPTILIPAAAVTGLSCEELEAILAHELAHIRRHDYLVNLLQSVVEALLFYHPAVWWVSHRIRVEREHCCDDLAVEVCGSRLVFAQALTALEETRPAPPRLAVALNGGSLFERIQRLMKRPSEPSHLPVRWLAGAIALSGIVCLVAGLRLSAIASENQKKGRSAESQRPSADVRREAQRSAYREPRPEGVVAVLGDSRFTHWNIMGELAVSPDGKRLATTGSDQTAVVWERETGKPLYRFELIGQTGSVAFSPDGTALAVGSTLHTRLGQQRQVQLWDLRTGKPRWEAVDLRGTSRLVFSPDGQMLASAGSGYAQLWDAATGVLVRTYEAHVEYSPTGTISGTKGIADLAFSPDGLVLATASHRRADDVNDSSSVGVIKLWNTETGELILTLNGHLDGVTAVAFSPDGELLASGSRDGTVRLWDPTTGTQEEVLRGHTFLVESLAFSPDGKLLTSGALDRFGKDDFEGTVRFWDVNTRQELRSIRGLIGGVGSLAFTTDGSTVVTVSQDHRVGFWDVATGQEKGPLPLDHGGLHRARFSPDGRTLATGSVDGTVELWDVGTWRVRRTLTGHVGYARSLAYSPDGGTLATAGQDGSIILWDVSTGTIKRKWEAHERLVWCLRYSPDGRTLASAGGDYTIKLWDSAKGSLRKTIPGQSKTPQGYNIMVSSLAFSNDGATLAAGAGWQVTLWDVESGELRETFQQPGNSPCLAFSPNGKTLGVGSLNYNFRTEGGREIRESLDGTITLWDLATGEPRDAVNVHSGEYINSIAFSPDGRTLASVGEDGRICFSDPQTARLRSSVQIGPQAGRSFQITYRPDGQYLASVNGNGTISIIQASDTEN